MKRITIRELHSKTGHWVRRAAEDDQVIVTDRGRPVAALVSIHRASKTRPLPNRWNAIKRMPRLPDSATYISEMRDRA